MISRFAERAVDAVFSQNSIKQEERELYVYGFFILFSKFFFFLLTIICGAIFGITIESIIFYVTFTALREYAGGVHASKEITCIIFTLASFFLSVLAIKLCIIKSLIIVPLIFLPLSGACIFILSPLDTEAKRLTDEEKKEYHIKSTIVALAIQAIAITSVFWGKISIFYTCVISLTLECILLMLSKAHNLELHKLR